MVLEALRLLAKKKPKAGAFAVATAQEEIAWAGGGARVSAGPYRVLAHPNYVAVTGELAGAAMMAGAWITGPVATLIFIGLMVKRVSIERAALDAILPPT